MSDRDFIIGIILGLILSLAIVLLFGERIEASQNSFVMSCAATKTTFYCATLNSSSGQILEVVRVHAASYYEQVKRK